jgi:hypothetical protein
MRRVALSYAYYVGISSHPKSQQLLQKRRESPVKVWQKEYLWTDFGHPQLHRISKTKSIWISRTELAPLQKL